MPSLRTSASGLRALAFGLALLATAFAVGRSPLGAQSVDAERLTQVRAAFLLNFVRYTEWPAASFPSGDSPYFVVVLDDDGVAEALEQLARRGITRLLVEGGPSVARVFLDADLIDEAVIYQGARPAGSEGLLPFVSEGLDRLTASGHFSKTGEKVFGPDRMTSWQRKRACSPALSAT